LRPDAASTPERTAWTCGLFGSTTSELVPGRALHDVTYPCFFRSPAGTLQLYYRTGSSGNGDSHLAEYDPTHGARRMIGQFVSGTGDHLGSASRNAYHNGFDYGPDKSLHTTWVWREGLGNRTRQLLNCHDLLYARSLDGGRTTPAR